MHKNIKIGYDAFSLWEIKMAQGKARGLIGKHGFTCDDIPDLEQELLLEIYLKRDARDNWSSIEASQKTVTSRILDNRIRDILDTLQTDKRGIHNYTESISKEIKNNNEEGTLTYEDVLGEDCSLSRRGKKPLLQEEELRFVMSMKLAKLNKSQRKICELLMNGLNISEAAKSLGIQRTTLCREIKRMRKLFYENGLHEYL
jgi:RNA polymerase sigma-70 factor (ECF subfamily)